MQTVTLNEYCDLPHPHHDWIIPNFMPKPGLVLLIGEAKVGKTSLAIQLSLAIGQGRAFLGQQAKQHNVLYIQCDVSEMVWRTMLSSYRSRGVDVTGNVYLIHPNSALYGLDVMTPEHTIYLEDAIRSCSPDVVVLDVLREFHSADEQDSTPMKLVIGKLLDIFTGLSVVIVHHTRKLDPSLPINPITASRGTSYLPGRADIIWLLHQSKLYIKGRLAPESVVPLRRLPSGLWATIDGISNLHGRGSRS